MPVYEENKGKLILNVSDSDNDVKITVNCLYGSEAQIRVDTGRLIKVDYGETKVLGKASALKNKILEFEGIAENPNGNKINVEHTIFEEGGEKITYVFPDDYTGKPELDKNDTNPSYLFPCKIV